MATGMTEMIGLLTLRLGTDAVLMCTMSPSGAEDQAGQICTAHPSGVSFQGSSNMLISENFKLRVPDIGILVESELYSNGSKLPTNLSNFENGCEIIKYFYTFACISAMLF